MANGLSESVWDEQSCRQFLYILNPKEKSLIHTKENQ